MAFLATHRERAYAILCDGAGDVGHTITAGIFRRAWSTAEDVEAPAAERVVELLDGVTRPVAGYNNPLDGRDISVTSFAVRVAYLLHEGGDLDTYDAAGAQSGGASHDAIRARAGADAKIISDAFGWLPSWTAAGLAPTVIDVAPDPDGVGAVDIQDDRALLVVPFLMMYRADLPGAYGPSLS